MKCVAIFAIMAVFAAAEFSDLVEEIEFTQEEAATESLSSAVSFLQQVADPNLHMHVKRIAKHAELLQDRKAAAYSHNFAASKAAIKAALNSLHTEMMNGHNHDKGVLSSEKTRLDNNTNNARNTGKNAVHKFRAKVCPEMRKEELAKAKEDAAKATLNKVKADKVCEPSPLGATWTDMDVEKTTPKMGTELRNAWDKARARWVAAKAAHDAAVKAAKLAKEKREKAMASFHTSLKIEASNVHSTCKSAKKEFETLCSDVQTNVKTRKQTYIATLVITCYIDNLTNNGASKTCADKQRGASTSKWDISCGSTTSCPGSSHWENTWGPSGWTPTKENCKAIGVTVEGVKKVDCAAGEKPAEMELFAEETAGLVQMMGYTKHHDDATGIYLKNKYIELGLDKKAGGRYGANYAKLPAGFYGRQGGKKKIGMVGDGDGFGIGKDLRIDYFLPGTHEERFQTGYKLSGKEHKAINYDKTFKDTSSGDVASMMSEGTSGPIKTKQEVSLGATDYYFRTKVTVTNVGKQTLQDVRYGRSCDPDNTVDMGGSYTTENHIKSTFAAGDKFASVSATSKSGDKYFKSAGSTSQLVYASVDKRAVPAYGNSGLYPKAGVFSSEVNTPHAKNKKHSKDAWIGMFVKFGNMAPGQTETFYFDTWMAESKVKIDEAAVAKASKSIAKVPTTKGCAAVACPAHSSGPDVRSGCTCSKSGTVTATKSAPFYKSTCSRL